MAYRTRPITLLVLMIALALAAALAGCSASSAAPAGTAPSSATPSTGVPSAGVPAPTIKVLAPLDGAEVAGPDLKVQVETTGLTFVMPSNTVVPGEGHVHFTLDDQPFKMSTTPDYVFKDVAPGPHTLKAELVKNDTKSFDPPVVQIVKYTVK